MTLGELRSLYLSLKKYEPEDINALLDFARQSYLRGSICISEYRNITRDLEAIGAKKPEINVAVRELQ